MRQTVNLVSHAIVQIHPFPPKKRMMGWDCLEDAECAGFIKHIGTGVNPRYKMTTKGNKVISTLQEHKANGNRLHDFEYEGE